MIVENWWNDADGGDGGTWTELCLSTALSVKNLIWNGTKSKPAFRDVRSVCNLLFHGMAKFKDENFTDCELYL